MAQNLFRHSSGRTLSFGFDMTTGKWDPGVICWDDGNGRWSAGDSSHDDAGRWRSALPVPINPEFVRECDGRILVYQPGLMIEMQFIGFPLMWGFVVSRPVG